MTHYLWVTCRLHNLRPLSKFHFIYFRPLFSCYSTRLLYLGVIRRLSWDGTVSFWIVLDNHYMNTSADVWKFKIYNKCWKSAMTLLRGVYCPIFCIVQEWVNIPVAYFWNYIMTICARCLAVIRANGRHTQYWLNEAVFDFCDIGGLRYLLFCYVWMIAK